MGGFWRSIWREPLSWAWTAARAKFRFGQFVVTEDRAAFADFLKRALATDVKQTCEVRLLRDGPPIYALARHPPPKRPGAGNRLSRGGHRRHQQKRADELAASFPGSRGWKKRHRKAKRRLRTLGDQIPAGAIYQHVQRPDGRVNYAI